jgi:hypothetical protein
MKTFKKLMLLSALLGSLGTPAGAMLADARCSLLAGEFGDRDKTGTTACPGNDAGPQHLNYKEVASHVSFQAEGMGFEPTTPFGAPDFESGRWPIRLPS